MNLSIVEQAVNWYKTELHLKEGDYVRFFVRYGGAGGIQPGFSLGVSKDSPSTVGSKTENSGITFYIEEDDLWYFDEHDLAIQYNEKMNEPVFKYN
ncbi:HesB/YadR/YfhF family protein [Litchfieldia alkalitelluris]|uniref:HesB/YadR/YfhF family protein n=1 Tax=Litchfieldia alkalitelluris TaxID=304268 RepID=UPI000996C597|nr:HesB/YadR/YfhF family protein [Litchfieldia alkalitelluris]